ncbi:Transcriptional regulatory protein sin3, partial [Ceratobasidium sp. 423]
QLDTLPHVPQSRADPRWALARDLTHRLPLRLLFPQSSPSTPATSTAEPILAPVTIGETPWRPYGPQILNLTPQPISCISRQGESPEALQRCHSGTPHTMSAAQEPPRTTSASTPGLSSLLPSTSPNTVPLALAAPSALAPSSHMNPNINPPIRYSPPRSPLPPDAPAPSSAEAHPLNVKDALLYLEMVKAKFQDKPDVYNHFLDIMKDFKSQERAMAEQHAREKEEWEKGRLDPKCKRRGLEKEPEKNGKPVNNGKRMKVAHRGDMEDLLYTGSPRVQQYHSNPNQPSTSPVLLQNPLMTPNEIAFFDCVRKLIEDWVVYQEFLKMLNLFVQEIIDAQTLVDHVRHYLNEELLVQFKEIISWDDRAVEADNGLGKGGPVAPALDRPHIDLGICPKFSPSYQRLLRTEINLACSGRDAMCWEVLNDEWVSHPTWLSEETGFTTGKKNSYEEVMHKPKEERHKYDFNIEALLHTIAILEPIKARIDAMDPDK